MSVVYVSVKLVKAVFKPFLKNDMKSTCFHSITCGIVSEKQVVGVPKTSVGNLPRRNKKTLRRFNQNA
mgnify:CR=1 FL=1